MSKPIKPSKSGHLLDAETWDALRKAGVPEDQLSAEQPLGPVIFAYTRAQAIEDGVLVDVTALARRAGYTIHTAITCGVVAEVTEGMSDDRMKQAALLAVLQTLRDCIRRSPNAKTDRLEFDVAHWKLWAHVGPGDDAKPVLTIMLIGED